MLVLPRVLPRRKLQKYGGVYPGRAKTRLPFLAHHHMPSKGPCVLAAAQLPILTVIAWPSFASPRKAAHAEALATSFRHASTGPAVVLLHASLRIDRKPLHICSVSSANRSAWRTARLIQRRTVSKLQQISLARHCIVAPIPTCLPLADVWELQNADREPKNAAIQRA